MPLALAWPALARGSPRARLVVALLLLPAVTEAIVRGASESGRHALVAWVACALGCIAFVALMGAARAERSR